MKNARKKAFFYFLWSLNWLSGKGSSGPAGGCPAYIYIYSSQICHNARLHHTHTHTPQTMDNAHFEMSWFKMNGFRAPPLFELPKTRNEKSAQRPKFSAGRPCGHPAKNFGQALQILEKQAFRHGHAAPTSTKKLRSEKLRADFSEENCSTFATENRRDLRLRFLVGRVQRGIPTKGIGETLLKVMKFRVFSGCFQGILGEFHQQEASIR